MSNFIKVCILLFLCNISTLVFSQDSLQNWQYGGQGLISASQTNYTHWASGGLNTFSANGISNSFLTYKKDKKNFELLLDLAFGDIISQDNKHKKTDDRFELAAKFGYMLSPRLFYTEMLSFRSQFAPGFQYPNDSTKISDILSPGYMILASGIDFKQGKVFTLLLSPLTFKLTIVKSQILADKGAFGVEKAIYNSSGSTVSPGSNIRNELGGYIKAAFKKEVFKNIEFQSRLELYSNYVDKPQNIDVNWEVLMNFKINKFITFNINTLLIYDDDIDIVVDDNKDGIAEAIGPRTQFKEVAGLGVRIGF